MREAVRVLLHEAGGIIPVRLVDADGPGGAHAVALKKNHDLPHDSLVAPAFRDPLLPRGTDAGDFRETRGVVLDDVEDLPAEGVDEFLGEVRPDAFDEA